MNYKVVEEDNTSKCYVLDALPEDEVKVVTIKEWNKILRNIRRKALDRHTGEVLINTTRDRIMEEIMEEVKDYNILGCGYHKWKLWAIGYWMMMVNLSPLYSEDSV